MSEIIQVRFLLALFQRVNIILVYQHIRDRQRDI